MPGLYHIPQQSCGVLTLRENKHPFLTAQIKAGQEKPENYCRYKKTGWRSSGNTYLPLPLVGPDSFGFPEDLHTLPLLLNFAEHIRPDGTAIIICGSKGSRLASYMTMDPNLPRDIQCWFSVPESLVTVTAYPGTTWVSASRRMIHLSDDGLTTHIAAEELFTGPFENLLDSPFDRLYDAGRAAYDKAHDPQRRQPCFFRDKNSVEPKD
jgi:hypothetical protein